MWTSFFYLIFVFSVQAKVDPPNYDFSLENLKPFFPGESKQALIAKHGEGLILKNGFVETRRFYVSQIRYKFPVVVTFYQDQVVDMFATLPSYFLHDIFHQSLINRFGKQDKFINYNGTALYTWANKDNKNLNYSSTCTITCFPLYFSASMANPPQGAYFTPLIDSLSAGHF
jgi:hypothetical protein